MAPQHEVDFHERFSFRPYWIGGDIWGSAPAGLRIPGPTDGSQNDERSARQKNEGDPHLRSARFVVGHVVQASDASIGHVEDYLFDESSWEIRYIVVDTQKAIVLSPSRGSGPRRPRRPL